MSGRWYCCTLNHIIRERKNYKIVELRFRGWTGALKRRYVVPRGAESQKIALAFVYLIPGIIFTSRPAAQ